MNDAGAVTRLPVALDPGAPRLQVEVSQAAADHLAAWDADQRVVAVHEAGHAICGAVLGLPVTDIDITSRHGGRTIFGLDADTQPQAATDAALRARIAAALAGSAAERLLLGAHTTLGIDDLALATRLAFSRLEAGMDPNAPLIATQWIGANVMPLSIVEEFGERAVATTRDARDRADAIVAANRAPLLAFAARIYERRRVSGAELEETLAALELVREPNA